MTARDPTKDYQLLRRLRQMRVLVIHPDDFDRKVLIDHIKRIGCQVDFIWPAPDVIPSNVDVVIFIINHVQEGNSLSWMSGDDSLTRIGIIAYETPEILTELYRFHVHGVLSKPIRVFGVLAALTTSISVSRHENRLRKRISSLDETLKARIKIEQATAILSESKNISEKAAYKKLRDKSMKDKCTIISIAEAIIASHDI